MSEEVQAVEEETLKVDAGDTLPDAAVTPAVLESSTVGRRLRAAREAARMSISDVAQTLKFSPRQIELIEADNYAALPGTTIVRGMTRSYARLLKLDAEVLLSLLDERTPVLTADVRPPENMGEAEYAGAPRQMSLLASAAIVILLVALLLAMWHFFGPAITPKANGVVSQSAKEPAFPPPGASISPAGPGSPVVAAVQTTPAATPVITQSSGTESSISATPALKFVFQGRSWLEVVDGQQQVLYTGENVAGKELVLSGKPPFDVRVGNAANVKLTYGERSIDLVPHTRAEVARLTVE